MKKLIFNFQYSLFNYFDRKRLIQTVYSIETAKKNQPLRAGPKSCKKFAYDVLRTFTALGPFLPGCTSNCT